MEGTGIFRFYSLDQIVEKIEDNTINDVWKPAIISRAKNNKQLIIDLASYLLSLDSTSWGKRIEHNMLDLYTNDKDVYKTISDKFKENVFHRFEPEDTIIELLDKPKTILCEKLPHNKYQYRAYLLPHKLAGDIDAKRKYLDWLITQKPYITCTPAVQKWFLKTDWNWDRRYILVEDERALLMLKLRNSEVVGSVYNYLVSDKY